MKKRRIPPRPGWPAAHVRIYLALLPSGPDAVHRLKLHRVRAAVQSVGRVYYVCAALPLDRDARRKQQIFREHLADHDSKEIDVENSRRRLRRADLRGLPCQIRKHRGPREAKEDALPEKNAGNREDVAAEVR